MPNNWKKYKLDDVVKIVDSLHKTPTYSTIGLPMVRVQNIDGGFMKLDGCIPVSQEVFNEFSRNHKSQKGDLVFSRVGAYSGKASIVKEDLNFCLGQNTAYIIPQDVNSEFLFYLINSAEIQNSLNLSAVVSSYKTISLKSLKELEITLPSNPEQQSIAEILSSLDDKIELNLQTNKTLEEMANALYKHWFVDFGPFLPSGRGPQDGRGPIPGFIESELGLIPEGWEVSTIKDVTEVITKGTTPTTLKKQFVDKGINFVKVESIEENGSFLINKFAHIDDETDLLLKRSRIFKDDILITIAGTIGRVAIVPDFILPANTNQAIGILRPNSKVVSPQYLMLSLKNEDIRAQLFSNVVESVQANLSLGIIGATKIVIPNFNEPTIKGTLEKLKELYNLIEESIIQNHSLKETRDYLLPKLISGEIRVKDAAKKVKELL